jgi:SAM-dependent methyltransferase
MPVQFRWEAHQFNGLLARCHRDEVVPFILRYLKKQGPILEAGCGLGRFVIFMEQQGFRDVRGIDISPDAVGIVNRIAPTVDVTCGDVSNLPFEDSSIRGIVSLGVVEHFEEGPQAALQEFKRVMMPGATAIITVPYLNLVRRFKHAARIYETRERITAARASVSARASREDVVGRSIAHLSQDNLLPQHKAPSHFVRWPATGPFFEYRFGIKQFERELRAVGLSILEVAQIDAISGMFYEFGGLLVSTSAQDGRALTRLGRVFKWILSRAPRVHAHMLLFVAHKDEVR